MNMHNVQSVRADADQRHLMSVSSNILNGQNCRTAFSLIQDVVMGLWMLRLV